MLFQDLMKSAAGIVAVCSAILTASSVRGDDHPATRSDNRPAFREGTDTIQAYGNYMILSSNHSVHWGGLNLGIGHYIYDDVAMNIEGTGLAVDQPGPDTYAGALGILLRQHVWKRDDLSLFADVGVSAFEANHDVPEDGTRFNFYFRTGLGATYPLGSNIYLLGGAHFVHISNARLWGSDRNPGVNGIEGYLGLMFTF